MGRRVALGVSALWLSGCLVPNPEYLGQGGTESGGVGGSSTTAEVSGMGSSTAAVTTGGTDSASGEAGSGTVTSDGESTESSSASASASSSTTGGASEVCPTGEALRVCLNFDVELAPDATEESVHMYPVSVDGASLVDSPWGQAFEFTSRTRVEVDCSGECAGGPAVTYEAWVRTDGMPAAGGRAGVIDNNGILGMFITDILALRCVSDGGTIEGGTVQMGEWTHVACVADDDTLLAYVDGVVVSSMSITPLVPTANPLPLGVGNNAPQFNDPLEGVIDRVHVWDEARTPEQLVASSSP